LIVQISFFYFFQSFFRTFKLIGFPLSSENSFTRDLFIYIKKHLKCLWLSVKS
jgi:hypothetical protein